MAIEKLDEYYKVQGRMVEIKFLTEKWWKWFTFVKMHKVHKCNSVKCLKKQNCKKIIDFV
jgi:hypothetical protein